MAQGPPVFKGRGHTASCPSIRYSALTPKLSTRKRGCDSTKAFDKVLYNSQKKNRKHALEAQNGQAA